jgi:hypothetical protein
MEQPLYSVGDIPTAVVVETGVTLAGYTTAELTVRDATGHAVATVKAAAVTEALTFIWPRGLGWPAAGLYRATVVLTGDARRRQLPSEAIVVEEEDGWLTLTATRLQWTGAPDVDADLYELLQIARQQVVDFAPEPVATAQVVSANYRQAQLLQARDIWNATLNAREDGLGEGGLSATFPMSWTVRNLIRPKRALPFAI